MIHQPMVVQVVVHAKPIYLAAEHLPKLVRLWEQILADNSGKSVEQSCTDAGT